MLRDSQRKKIRVNGCWSGSDDRLIFFFYIILRTPSMPQRRHKNNHFDRRNEETDRPIGQVSQVQAQPGSHQRKRNCQQDHFKDSVHKIFSARSG